MNPFDFFDKIYYINLDSRIDRREKMEEQLNKLGITAERFPAITLTEEQNNHLIKEEFLSPGEHYSDFSWVIFEEGRMIQG